MKTNQISFSHLYGMFVKDRFYRCCKRSKKKCVHKRVRNGNRRLTKFFFMDE